MGLDDWLKIHEKIYIEIILSNFIKQNRKEVEVSIGTVAIEISFRHFTEILLSP